MKKLVTKDNILMVTFILFMVAGIVGIFWIFFLGMIDIAREVGITNGYMSACLAHGYEDWTRAGAEIWCVGLKDGSTVTKLLSELVG